MFLNANDTHLHLDVNKIVFVNMSSTIKSKTTLTECINDVRVYQSKDLLQAKKRAEILHRGERYILRETKAGRLILNK